MVVGGAYTLAACIRSYIDTGGFSITGIYLRYFWICYVVMALWPLLLDINGIYSTMRFKTIGRAVGIIVKSSLQGLFFMLALLFIFKLQIVSRTILTGFAFNVIILLSVKECAIIYFLRKIRRLGVNFRQILVVGTLNNSRDLIAKIRNNSFLGLKVIGLLVPKKDSESRDAEEINILGTLNDVEKVLNDNPIDSVIITLNRRDYKIDDILFRFQKRGIEICLVPDIFNIKTSRFDTDEILGTPLFIFRMGPKFSWHLLAKNVADRVGGFIFCILSLPLIAVASILIKATSKGPAFFKQTRCCTQGRVFTFYKLRTMYEGAEAMKKKLEHKNIMKGPAFKLEKDPRITPLGYFLRRTSIDETPQFWNVLKGEMSLVGPRPPIPEEVERYTGWQRRRLSMKPGITGLWQIKGRSKITNFDEWAELDLEYIDTWSLWLDLRIFINTIWVVLLCRGAK